MRLVIKNIIASKNDLIHSLEKMFDHGKQTSRVFGKEKRGMRMKLERWI